MFNVPGFPFILSESETKEVNDIIEVGGKYVLFEFQPNDRRLKMTKLKIYDHVTSGGNKNIVCFLYGQTAIALTLLYNNLALTEIHSQRVLCDYGLGNAYKLEEIIKYFGYNKENVKALGKVYQNRKINN